MRRVVAITTFALLLSIPVWAQHGGGGHGGGFGGGGHVGGFSGGHVGGFSGGHVGGFSSGHSGFSGSSGVHAYSGPRSFPGYSRDFSHLPPTYGFNHPPTYGFTPPTSGFARQPFANNRFGFNGFGGNRFNRGIGIHIGTYPYCWGCWAYGYPWWDAGYFDPWWWWDSQDNNGNNDDYNNNLAIAEQMNEQSLEQQQMLRQEEADGDQDAYNQPRYNQPDAGSQRNTYAQEPYVRPPLDPQRMAEAEQRNHAQTADSTMRPTVLIFRDQHKQEVENYAIVGQTLWNFTAQRTVKIPLSELDVPATIKANQDRGVTFTVPSSDQGS